MKKIIYLFCLICTITLAKGQYYRPDRGFLPGINAGYFYPTGDMGKILKNGIGGNVSAKYLINNRYRFRGRILRFQNQSQSKQRRCLPKI